MSSTQGQWNGFSCSIMNVPVVRIEERHYRKSSKRAWGYWNSYNLNTLCAWVWRTILRPHNQQGQYLNAMPWSDQKERGKVKRVPKSWCHNKSHLHQGCNELTRSLTAAHTITREYVQAFRTGTWEMISAMTPITNIAQRSTKETTCRKLISNTIEAVSLTTTTIEWSDRERLLASEKSTQRQLLIFAFQSNRTWHWQLQGDQIDLHDGVSKSMQKDGLMEWQTYECAYY